MCLAPCFKGCTDEEYAAEVERVQSSFRAAGNRWCARSSSSAMRRPPISTSRARLRLHARLEKVKADRLAVAGDRAPPRRAEWCDDPAVGGAGFGCAIQNRRWADLRSGGTQCWASRPKPRTSARGRSRWNRASPRRWGRWRRRSCAVRWSGWSTWRCSSAGTIGPSKTGELFLTDSNGELPMRRVVRGVSRVFRGEKACRRSERDGWRLLAIPRARSRHRRKMSADLLTAEQVRAAGILSPVILQSRRHDSRARASRQAADSPQWAQPVSWPCCRDRSLPRAE